MYGCDVPFAAIIGHRVMRVPGTVQARPAEESVLTALRRAVVGIARAHADGGTGRNLRALLLRSPTVRAAALQQGALRSSELARLLAVRMGVYPARDGRPLMAATTVLCALQATVHEWQVQRPDVPLADLLDEAFDLVEDGPDHPPGATQRDDR